MGIIGQRTQRFAGDIGQAGEEYKANGPSEDEVVSINTYRLWQTSLPPVGTFTANIVLEQVC